MTDTQRRTLLKGGAAAAATAASTTLWAQQKTPIRIGLTTPLSGPQEFLGTYVKNGAEVAVDQINKAGGVLGRPLQLVIRDDKAAPVTAVAATREMLAEGINLHMGTISSAVLLAMAPVMAQENAILITSGAGTEKLNNENYTPNVFRVGDSPDTRCRGQARLMAQKYPNVTRWTGLVPDHEYGRTTWALFVDGLLEYYPKIAGKKPEIVDPILMPYGVSDYRQQITQALRVQADGCFNSTYGGDAITMFQQARGFGLVNRYKVLMDAANEFLVARGMKSAVPAHWTGMHYYPAANKGNPISDQFIADYAAKYKDDEPMGWAAEAHAGVYALAEAIRKTGGTDTKALIGALKGLTWDTVTGKRTIRPEDNQAMKDTELVLIEPADTPKGYKVAEYVKVSGQEVILPPNPGKPLQLRKA